MIKVEKKEKYYITEVDANQYSIYCHHDLMGELLIPNHSHDKDQFLYTEGGVVYVKTEKKTYFLPARHFMWIPAGVKHSIHPNAEDVIMRNLYFPKEEMGMDFYKKEGIYPVNDLLLNLLLFTNRWNGNLEQDTRNYTIAKALKVLLPELSGNSLELSLPLAKDKRLLKITEYINAHLHEHLLFTDIAQQYGFSTRTLHRIFTKDLSMSFIQYFTICRMLRAIELLQKKNIPVSEVALSVGYNSLPSFSNTFYKLLGQRPSEYAKGKNILEK
ncbi:AraC family transcriptional regulator [Flavobacterium arcticum]|uniref:AraC family transcriptional regulator n=1 Tax=Flavobacterium arcticum TaxID=1784713 RepID=A0A345HDQ6_9FLAO|nr:AraC family transcriptional regulator [Flavobacterium arcticum]AXG74716.1 AraC family transcriptional regulator [Flavobacterium arcticum]KAF2509785.1 AraC family transcriptional regulator [Flavobacterium arcticum]